jgi:hypothetical protein
VPDPEHLEHPHQRGRVVGRVDVPAPPRPAHRLHRALEHRHVAPGGDHPTIHHGNEEPRCRQATGPARGAGKAKPNQQAISHSPLSAPETNRETCSGAAGGKRKAINKLDPRTNGPAVHRLGEKAGRETRICASGGYPRCRGVGRNTWKIWPLGTLPWARRESIGMNSGGARATGIERSLGATGVEPQPILQDLAGPSKPKQRGKT